MFLKILSNDSESGAKAKKNALAKRATKDAQRAYVPGMFSDVPAGEWFEAGVKVCYETGLLDGFSEGLFAPYRYTTFLQTIISAARLHSIIWETGADFSGEDPWYRPYVEYALDVCILNGDDWLDMTAEEWNHVISAKGFICFLSMVIPEEYLRKINTLPKTGIPDLAKDDDAYGFCVRFLEAGLVSGNDKYARLLPDTGISRADAALILARILEPSLRARVKWSPLGSAEAPIPFSRFVRQERPEAECGDTECQQEDEQ